MGTYWAHDGLTELTPIRFQYIVGAMCAHRGRIVSEAQQCWKPIAFTPKRLKEVMCTLWAHRRHIASTCRAHRFHSKRFRYIAGTLGASSGHILGALGTHRFHPDTILIHSGHILGASRAHVGTFERFRFRSIVGPLGGRKSRDRN